MLKAISQLLTDKKALRYILHSVIFNFKNLPLKQAYKIPILLYKPRIIKGGGRIIINQEVTFGMIKLGFPCVPIYNEKGVTIKNEGTIVFNGTVRLDAGVAFQIGRYGILSFGDDIRSTCGSKFCCFHRMNIGSGTLIGWNCVFSDTDFHALTSIADGRQKIAYAPVSIGKNVWIAAFCKFYKGAVVPDKCIVASDTIVRGYINVPENSIIYNKTNISHRQSGYEWKWGEDIIDYECNI